MCEIWQLCEHVQPAAYLPSERLLRAIDASIMAVGLELPIDLPGLRQGLTDGVNVFMDKATAFHQGVLGAAEPDAPAREVQFHLDPFAEMDVERELPAIMRPVAVYLAATGGAEEGARPLSPP